MAMPLVDGGEFGPYTILDRLGRGGMASVYCATERRLDREVALKVLPEELVESPGFAERFEREAKVIARLEHPCIVPLYAYGIDEGRPWMALRLVRGGHLGDLFEAGKLDRAAGLALFSQLAAALDHAHANGVIHRDLKPQNVLVDSVGHAYLADFGIARLLEGATTLTATGAAIGTPQYMAPEQAEGKAVGPATDVYALAVICYRWLTGEVPFSADTPLAVLLKHLQAPVPLAPLADHGEAVKRVLLKALAKAADERYASAGEFVAALEAALMTGHLSDAAAASNETLTADRPSAAAGAGAADAAVSLAESAGANTSIQVDDSATPATVAAATAEVRAVSEPAAATTELLPKAVVEPKSVAHTRTIWDWICLSVAALVAAAHVTFAVYAAFFADFRPEDFLIASGFALFGLGMLRVIWDYLELKPWQSTQTLRIWLYTSLYFVPFIAIVTLNRSAFLWSDMVLGAFILLAQGIAIRCLSRAARRQQRPEELPSLSSGRRMEWLLLILGSILTAVVLCAYPESRKTDPPLICLWSLSMLWWIERSLHQPRSGSYRWALISLIVPLSMIAVWLQKNQPNIAAVAALSVTVTVLWLLLARFDTRRPLANS